MYLLDRPKEVLAVHRQILTAGMAAAALLAGMGAAGEEFLPGKGLCERLSEAGASTDEVSYCKAGMVVSRLRITSMGEPVQEQRGAQEIIRAHELCERALREGYDGVDESRAIGCFLREVGSSAHARARYERELALFGWKVPVRSAR